MTDLTEATPKQIFRELRKRLKNEITNEELTKEFWDCMKPDEDDIKIKAENLGLSLVSDDDIQDGVEAKIPNTELFRILTKLAYLPNTATIRDLNEIQREARYHLSTEYKQFHGMGV
jgi:hypothetical protein